MPLKQCKQCKKDFYSVRHDAQFCNANCRVTHNRGVTDNVTDNVTDKNETDNSDNPDNPKCKYCGTEITQEKYGKIYYLVECCYDCAKSRAKTRNNLK